LLSLYLETQFLLYKIRDRTWLVLLNGHMRHQNHLGRGTGLAQSIKHVTLDLGVVDSSPMLGVEIT